MSLAPVERPDAKDLYFCWLYNKVAGKKLYTNLASYLHNRWEFRWTVDYDENRQGDGYQLREDWVELNKASLRPKERREILAEPVSVFEVLVALTLRLNFDMYDSRTGDQVPRWFNELIENLGLSHLDDDNWPDGIVSHREVDSVMTVWLDRTYEPNGEGSCFPLSYPRPDMDMRTVELWYQMMAYMDDHYPI